MTSFVRGIVFLSAVTLCTVPGVGQVPGRGGGSPLFRALDANGDGVLSESEISNAASSLRKLDRDRNGTVERREMQVTASPVGDRPVAEAPSRTPGSRNAPAREGRNSSFGGRSRGGTGLESAPDVGERLPNLTVFRADGEPFRLGQLKDGYTVLVFGCLT